MDNTHTLRPATPDDLDGILDVIHGSMPYDPEWNYRYAHKEEFPDDHARCTRLIYEWYISPANDDRLVTVAVSPSGRIAATAVWDLSSLNKTRKGPGYSPQVPLSRTLETSRRDLSPQRRAAFRAAAEELTRRCFNEVYGDGQLQLQVLAVHPEFWRRNLGSELVRWGVKRAAEENVAVTLLAGQGGVKLYEKLGFRNVGHAFAQVPGEDEKVSVDAMVYEHGHLC
jgi:ribosomal protein S18 acetylase RimI-like enzyme